MLEKSKLQIQAELYNSIQLDSSDAIIKAFVNGGNLVYSSFSIENYKDEALKYVSNSRLLFKNEPLYHAVKIAFEEGAKFAKNSLID